MRTFILTVLTSVLMTAQTPKPTPPVLSRPVAPPSTSMFNEADNLKLENIQLRRQLATNVLAELNTALNVLFLKNCQAIGGATMADCTVIEPSERQPGFGVTLKPVMPITADGTK